MFVRILALFLAASAATFAQEFRGTVLGRVTDPSGAVVPGAAVSVTNEETNVRVDAKSNADGNFNIPFLLPAKYTVRVEAPGFKAAMRPGIVVQINDRVTLDFSLELGATSDTITVTADTPMFQIATADMGQVVERDMIERLPMNSMNAMNLADMAPGVLAGSGNQVQNGQNDIAINGGSGRERGNDITIDGIPNVAPRFNGLAVTVPSSDAIQEFKVATTMFDAQNGRSNGGVISFTTRGGTNNFHGSGYYFFYDELSTPTAGCATGTARSARPSLSTCLAAASAAPWFCRSTTARTARSSSSITKSSKRENDFTRYARVPTELERKGDFSQTLSLTNTTLGMYDPYSTEIIDNRTVRQPYPNATIPLNQQDPTGQAVMNLYGKPNQNVTPRIGTFNWLGQGRYKGIVDNYTVRLDQMVSSKQRLYFRFSQLDGLDTREPFAMKGMYSMPSSASGTTTDEINPRHNKSAAIDDSYSFTPTLFASFRYGYTRTNLDAFADGNRYDARDMKMPEIVLANQVSGGYPMIAMGENIPQFGSRLRASVNDTHSLYITFNQLAGRHTIKYGLDTRAVRWHENAPGEIQNGRFNFDTRFTRSDPTTTATQNTSGTAMGALLLGLPNDAQIGYNSALSLQSWYTALYFQDDLKVTPKLTLNLGVRWELETPQTERFNRIAYGMDPGYPVPLQIPGMPQLKGALLFVDQDGRGRRQGETDYNNFGPRFGFAYKIDGNTAIRGGYGLFYASAISNISGSGSVNVNALGSQPSFNVVSRIPNSNSTNGGRTPITTMQNPFPNGIAKPTGNSLGVLSELGNTINYANPFRRTPYNQQWQFSIQRVIGWSTMVDAGYVGSHALKLFNDYNWNERSDIWLQQGVNESTSVPNPFWGIFPATSSLGGSRNIAQGRLWYPFPQFNNVNVFGMNTNRALYHSFQFALRKRMSHGLSATVNYTYSKNMVYDGASLVNDRQWRAVASSDRPHIFRVFATYSLPFGRRTGAFERPAGLGRSDRRRMGICGVVPDDERHAALPQPDPRPADSAVQPGQRPARSPTGWATSWTRPRAGRPTRISIPRHGERCRATT